MKTIKTSELTRAAADLPAERYFTVVYKLTDANTAKYLSNRDWVTYVYADSMAELASLKELSAEPAVAVYAELPEALHRVIDDFERRERGIPQAHIAAALVTELRAALAAGQATAAQAAPAAPKGDIYE